MTGAVADTDAATRYGILLASMAFHTEPWSELGPRCAAAEADGCEAIWLTDHLLSGYPAADALVLAGIVASHTEHCTVGTGILQLPLRRAAAVAKAATTIQLVAQGRFVLGVGVGQHRAEFDRVGVDFSRRGRIMDQALDELAAYHEPQDWFGLRPAAAVPIWIGGHSDAALARTARHANGWMPLFLSATRFAKATAQLDERLLAAGRAPDAVRRTVTLVVGETDADWTSTQALEFAGQLFPTGAAGLDRYVITGDLDTCVARVRTFIEAGAEGILFNIAHPDTFERYHRLVAALRSHDETS